MLRWLGLEAMWHGKLFIASFNWPFILLLEGRKNGQIPHLFSFLPRKVILVFNMWRTTGGPNLVAILPNLFNGKFFTEGI